MTEVVSSGPKAPKRFFETARIEEAEPGYVLRLDERTARTPAGCVLAAPGEALAHAVAEEWNAQGETLDLTEMRLTRLLTTALDRGRTDRESWIDQLTAYLETDALCCRADHPEKLVMRQRAVWDPFLGWARDALGLDLSIGQGVAAPRHGPGASERARAVFARESGHAVIGVKAACEAAGSCVLALAVWKQFADAEDAFAASRLEETFQAERWGADSEAQAREQALRADFLAAASFLRLL